MKSVSIPGKELVPIIKHTLKSGSDFKLLVTGNSMFPFLKHNRDSVLLTAVPNVGIKKGVIVFIQRENGEYVLHRVVKVLKNNTFLMNGDSQTWTEPVCNNQVFACVRALYRKGRIIRHSNLLYSLLVRIWILLRPYRPKVFKLIRLFMKLVS